MTARMSPIESSDDMKAPKRASRIFLEQACVTGTHKRVMLADAIEPISNCLHLRKAVNFSANQSGSLVSYMFTTPGTIQQAVLSSFVAAGFQMAWYKTT